MTKWKSYKIGEIVDVRRGSSPRPIHNFLTSTGMPWVKIADATSSNSRYISNTNEYIKEEGIKYSVFVEPETLIVSNSATPGLPKIMKIKACVHDGWLVFNNYKGVIRDFLYYKFVDIQKLLINQANGSVFQNLKTDIVKDFDILLPSIEEQQKIVSILLTIDNKIELNQKQNNNLEQQAMALFKSWFVDKFNPNRKTIKAEEFFNISIGKTPPRKEQEWFSENPNDVKWVSISDMGNCGMFISDSSEYLISSAISKFNVKIVPNNTVLLSFKLTVGRIAITDGEMTTNEAIAHFVTDNSEINEYLYCYLKNFNFQTMGSTSSIATAVNSKIIKSMPFVMPIESELKEFHSIVFPMFEQIKFNQRENSRLANLRDILLPKLMSGEIDVSKVKIDEILDNSSTDKLSFTGEK